MDGMTLCCGDGILCILRWKGTNAGKPTKKVQVNAAWTNYPSNHQKKATTNLLGEDFELGGKTVLPS
jgi:hypothetical protein